MKIVYPLRDGIGFVEQLNQMGSDLTVVNAARVSYGKQSDVMDEKAAKLINYLLKNRHGSPFEHVVFTFRVKAPLFIVHQWERHRMASYNEECLSGDTVITRLSKNHNGVYQKKGTLSTLWRNWHEGVPDTMGRTRLLASCRSVYVRSFDERFLTPQKSKVTNIKRQGIQRTYLVTTESGRSIRATMSHKFFTPDGWRRLEEMSCGSYVYRAGKVREDGEPRVPVRLRQGIQVWTTQQKQFILPRTGGHCYICLKDISYEEAQIDHEIPVVKDLTRALDIANLKPACTVCHRIKSNGEQQFADRAGTTAGVRPDRIVSISNPLDEETYDLVLENPFHNFIGNGLVVHNSGRYRELDPEFYTQTPIDKLAADNAYNLYKTKLANGFSKEDARTVLPISLYKSFWFTVNARSLMNFLSLRNDEHAQAEIRAYAHEIELMFAEAMPVTWRAFHENGRRAP